MSDLALAEKPQTPTGDWQLGPICDADAHIDPPHTMWKDYLPAHLRDQAKRIEEGDD